MVPDVIESLPEIRERRTPIAGVLEGRLWMLVSGTLLTLVILERWVLSVHSFGFDVWAAHVGMSHKAWPIWDITRVYQQVGRPLVAIGEVLVMFAWLWRRAGRLTALGLGIVLVASVINGVIKIICGPTPLWQVLPHHVGTNFPSGVVTFMTASVGYVALVALRLGRRRMGVLLAIAIVGAGPARVVGGQHLISDVFGAYMLGSAWLIVGHAYLRKLSQTVEGEPAWQVAAVEATA